ncbi:MAG: lipid-A-disaccharide synthase N-terminal domain-containing protein [Acidobacteria bacterium]|nr:lipid-A-disaccharide synthase N-terminal domain-containing protein [Acidobacteriota bacterium]
MKSWHWDLWLIVGFAGQSLFASRFIVQWLMSEKKKTSHIPVEFWYLSLAGGLITSVYAIHRRDPVFVIAQLSGLIVYIRNLMLIRRHAAPLASPDPPADRP